MFGKDSGAKPFLLNEAPHTEKGFQSFSWKSKMVLVRNSSLEQVCSLNSSGNHSGESISIPQMSYLNGDAFLLLFLSPKSLCNFVFSPQTVLLIRFMATHHHFAYISQMLAFCFENDISLSSVIIKQWKPL